MKPSLRGQHGSPEWYFQRLSAIVLLCLSPAVLWLVIGIEQGQLNQVMIQHWLTMPLVQLAHSLFAVAVLLHGYLGVKIIMEDYLHQAKWRVATLAVVQLIAVATLIFWLTAIWF